MFEDGPQAGCSPGGTLNASFLNLGVPAPSRLRLPAQNAMMSEISVQGVAQAWHEVPKQTTGAGHNNTFARR
eukprot:739018-Amphidinium_carterae.1